MASLLNTVVNLYFCSSAAGVIPRLIDYYSKGVHNVSFARFSLNLDHFSSSLGDSGWGCGYRNIQMLLSAMVEDPKFKDVVFNGEMLVNKPYCMYYWVTQYLLWRQ